jgi:hypothetical protein
MSDYIRIALKFLCPLSLGTRGGKCCRIIKETCYVMAKSQGRDSVYLVNHPGIRPISLVMQVKTILNLVRNTYQTYIVSYSPGQEFPVIVFSVLIPAASLEYAF